MLSSWSRKISLLWRSHPTLLTEMFINSLLLHVLGCPSFYAFTNYTPSQLLWLHTFHSSYGYGGRCATHPTILPCPVRKYTVRLHTSFQGFRFSCPITGGFIPPTLSKPPYPQLLRWQIPYGLTESTLLQSPGMLSDIWRLQRSVNYSS